MNTSTILTSLISLLPAVLVTVCIFWLDRMEKEPLSMLLRMLLLGAVAYFAAYFLRLQVVTAISRAMADQMEVSLTGVVSFDRPAARLLNQMLNAWGAQALIDALAMWVVMRLFVSQSPEFDCFFDGIVYGAATALGFAVSDCLFYAVRFGMDTLILRALVTAPAMVMYGILMGLLFSAAKEREAGAEGSGRVLYLAALAVPALAEGLLAYIRLNESPSWHVPEAVYMILLTVVSAAVVSAGSQRDHYFPDIRQF